MSRLLAVKEAAVSDDDLTPYWGLENEEIARLVLWLLVEEGLHRQLDSFRPSSCSRNQSSAAKNSSSLGVT
jgi:hypothetical protein